MGKCFQFLTELSACDMSIFSFLDNNLSKSQWIFTKYDMCIDIVEIWFWIAHWQILSIFEQLSARNIIKAGDYGFMFLFILGHEKAGVCSVRFVQMCICGSLCLLNSCYIFYHIVYFSTTKMKNQIKMSITMYFYDLDFKLCSYSQINPCPAEPGYTLSF